MKNLLTVIFAIASTALWADPSVTGLAYRQNWPWGPEVNVDYTLTADAACDVDVTVSWTVGQNSQRKTLMFNNVQPGAQHFTWNPLAEGVADQSVRNFTVTVAAALVSARTYLVVDLLTGAHEYLADVPAGGWTDEHKLAKMVFRRIPAGTYRNGESYGSVIKPIYNMPNQSVNQQATMTQRTVVLSSDFYMAIFPMTGRQYEILSGAYVNSVNYKKPYCSGYSYETLRGAPTGGSVCVNWPNTRYAVEPTSVVGRFRALMKKDFLVDLPTEEMWEIAARAGTTTPFPNGGTLEFEPGKDPYTEAAITNLDDLTACVRRLGWCQANPDYSYSEGFKEVGLLDPNNWGLYDVIGNNYEWTLDAASDNVAISDITYTDPVGESCPSAETAPKFRVVRSIGYGGSKFLDVMPARRSWYAQTTASAAGVRFCIHLKSLFGE